MPTLAVGIAELVLALLGYNYSTDFKWLYKRME